MESVEWIFSEHKLHLSMLQLLRDEQALLTKDTSNEIDQDDEIGGMVLAPPPLDGMPHAHGAGSSTEWVVMKLNSINQNHQNLSNEIKRYYRLLRLHDAVMCTMNDTIVDDKIISSNSLHGQYIQKYAGITADELRELFDNDLSLRDHIARVDMQRTRGSQTAYELGTIYKHNDYLLLAFTKFDSSNRAYLDNKLLWNCLINMWKNIDVVHNGQSICLPLLGTGITRLKEMNLNEQQLLELLLVSLRLSGVKFNWNVKVTIIVYSGNQDMIDLYGLSTYSD